MTETLAGAGGPGREGDHVRVRGLRVMGVHGVLDEEKKRPQPFVVDLDLLVDLADAGRTDDLRCTVDYAAAAETAGRVVASESYCLIERLAERIAEELLKDPRIIRATVAVAKPKAPIGVDAADVQIEVTRGRD